MTQGAMASEALRFAAALRVSMGSRQLRLVSDRLHATAKKLAGMDSRWLDVLRINYESSTWLDFWELADMANGAGAVGRVTGIYVVAKLDEAYACEKLRESEQAGAVDWRLFLVEYLGGDGAQPHAVLMAELRDAVLAYVKAAGPLPTRKAEDAPKSKASHSTIIAAVERLYREAL